MSYHRQRATELVIGGTLPSLKFFEPTSRFLAWMQKTWRGNLIYDVGAGCGHVSAALSEKRLQVKAIDINHRECEGGSPVEIADGEGYEYVRGSVVMLCRPCHGDFTGEVISQAIRCRVSTILYVGLKKNFFGDLGVQLLKFKKVLTGSGLEGEDVLQWKLEA